MIDIEHHELQRVVQEDLGQRLTVIVTRLGYTPASVQAQQQAIDDIRAKCRKDGIYYPPMVPVLLHKAKAIEWLRRDLDYKSVRIHVKNFITKYPEETPHSLAQAIARAFPEYAQAQFDKQVLRQRGESLH